jgi:hypothetical protein
MKTILSVVGTRVLRPCGRAGREGRPGRDWKCEYKIGDQQRTSELTIQKDGDNLSGTMNWPDQKDEKLKDVKFKDGKLTFSAVRKFMDNTIPIDYTFTIDGDKLKGKGAAEFGARNRSSTSREAGEEGQVAFGGLERRSKVGGQHSRPRQP